MNQPTASKINWTAGIMALIGIAVALDWIPPEIEEPLTNAVLIFGPTLIMVFRTWFTDPDRKRWFT